MIYVGGESNFVLIRQVRRYPYCCYEGGDECSIPEKRSSIYAFTPLYFFNPHMSFFVVDVDLSALYNVFLV